VPTVKLEKLNKRFNGTDSFKIYGESKDTSDDDTTVPEGSLDLPSVVAKITPLTAG